MMVAALVMGLSVTAAQAQSHTSKPTSWASEGLPEKRLEFIDLVAGKTKSVRESVSKELLVGNVLASPMFVDICDVGALMNGLTQSIEFIC